jgi:hypothetical protein
LAARHPKGGKGPCASGRPRHVKEEHLAAIRKHEGKSVWVTLAYGDLLLCRVDMDLEEVSEEEGRLSLVGSFREVGEIAVYREINLPLPDQPDEGVFVEEFGGETRLETSEGFFLQLVPLG